MCVCVYIFIQTMPENEAGTCTCVHDKLEKTKKK